MIRLVSLIETGNTHIERAVAGVEPSLWKTIQLELNLVIPLTFLRDI